MDFARLGIEVDTKDVKAATTELGKLSKQGGEAEKRMSSMGATFTKTGKALSLGVTAPLTALGVASIRSSNIFNKSMAEIATLIPGNVKRVNELKESVKQLSTDVGRDTKEISRGLFQVISAFGDSSDTVRILEINARAATAGLSSTEDAIALTSAVTKAYGDTSAEAVKKVTDLAFQTNKLGQTTFPELAGAMGRVTPLAKALNVSQEELFGSMATLTGVTGNTNEVSTQLRATYQAFLKPTKEMSVAIREVAGGLAESGKISGPLVDEFLSVGEAMDRNVQERNKLNTATKEGQKLEKESIAQFKQLQKQQDEVAAGLGGAIVEGEGFQGALELVAKEADGNSATLGKMFGSVEAINAVLALTGEQSEDLARKTKAMDEATGASGQAFLDMTDGVNKSGFAFDQLQQKSAVISTTIGEGLTPAFAALLEAAKPLIELVLSMAQAFAQADPAVQQIIVGVTAFVAALGPLALIAGTLAPLLPALAAAFTALTGPVGLAIAALAGVAFIVANWEEVKAKVLKIVSSMVEGIKTWLIDRFETLVVQPVKQKIEAVTGFFSDMFDAVVGNSFVPDMVDQVGEHFDRLDHEMVEPTKTATQRTQDSFREMAFNVRDTLKDTLNEMLTGVLRGTQSMSDAFKRMGQNIIASLSNQAIQGAVDSLFGGGAGGASSGGSPFGQLGQLFGGGTSTTPGGAGSPVLGPPPPPGGGLFSSFSGAGALGGLGAGFGIGTGLESLIGGGQATQFGGAAGGAIGGAFFGPAGALGGSLIGSGIGKGLSALFKGGPGGKDKLSLRTGAGGALSVAGDAKGGSLIKLVQGIDDAVAARLTSAQLVILQEDIEGSKLKSSSRKLKDIVNEIAFKRLEQTLTSLGESSGIDDLAGRVLTGEKFSEEKLANTLNAIEFINNFESSVKSLNDGLLDLDGTVERLARESIQQTQQQLEAFRDETERLGLDTEAANEAIKGAVEVMVGLREAKEPLSEVEQALARVRAEFDAMAPLLDEVGIAAEAAGRGLIRALGEIRQGFESEIQRQINAFRSPITNTLEDLFATQAQRLSDAQAVNADLGPVVELIGEEFKAVVAGLDPTQLQTAVQLITRNVRDLGDTLGGDALAGLSSVFAPSPAVLATNQRITEATEELERLQGQVNGTSDALRRVQATANDVANVFEGLGKFRQRLLQGQFSTLSPGARFAQAQGQFESTASRALGGDIAALQELENVSDAFLKANEDYFASSNPKAFTRVLEVLGQAQSISELEFIAAQQQALTLENQLVSLDRQIEIQEEELQKEIDSLAELEALNQGQNEQTLALEAAIKAVGTQLAAATQAQTEAANAATQAALNAANATDVQTQAVTTLLTEINANVNEGNRNAQQLVGVS
jgi:TP901 family phage tail tape measure protein